MKQIELNIDDLIDVPCSCGSLYFTHLIRIKHVSALQSPEGREGKINISGLVCVECGKSDIDAINYFEQKMLEEFNKKVIPINLTAKSKIN